MIDDLNITVFAIGNRIDNPSSNEGVGILLRSNPFWRDGNPYFPSLFSLNSRVDCVFYP